MSKIEESCLFDNSKEYPARKTLKGILRTDLAVRMIAEKACPICPKRIRMIPVSKIK